MARCLVEIGGPSARGNLEKPMTESEPRFEVTFLIQRGAQIGPFPVTLEAAMRAVELAASGSVDDRPFPLTILQQIEEEPAMLGGRSSVCTPTSSTKAWRFLYGRRRVDPLDGDGPGGRRVRD